MPFADDADNAAATDRFARVREAFHQLVQIAPEERGEELARIAAADAELGAALRRLIAHVDEADLVAQVPRAPPQQLGPFRLLRSIGRGGMGEVYLAERSEGGFEQQVALKLMRDSALSPDLTRRFLRERQILARLIHPNIAHLVDGGFGDDGRPWLAMEYVRGERITQWCDARGLGVEERVKLFLPVCAAVAFAHRNLIVHRDLKPANLLVDAEGRPRLLDFGIARLLDTDSDAQTQLLAPLTPAYAAPEQRVGGAITTATDVYQLGTVLRELVSDSTSAARNDVRALRGDLGRILEKACAEAPGERYAGVTLLADDLCDWLARAPLRSGIGSRRERLRKTLWQWRWPLALAGAVLVALTVGGALVLREARAKAREAEVSQQTTQFLIDLFQGADPALARGNHLSAQDLLDQGNARLHGATRLQPLVRARLLRTVADSYVALGHYDGALSPAEEALALRYAAGDEAERADSLAQVGNIRRLRAEYAKAEPLLLDALERRRLNLPRDDPATIASLSHLAALRSAQGDFKAADALFAEAAQAAERRYGEDSAETARHLDDYAGNLDDMGRRNEALALLRRALAIRERVLGRDHADVATTLLGLGVHLSGSGRYDEAVALLERAVAIRRTIYGQAHPLVAFAQIGLAGVYADQNRLDPAQSLAQEALGTVRSTLPPGHPKVIEALNMLALIRILRRDYAGAIELQQEVVQRHAASAGEDHPDTLTLKNNLAYALLHAGRAAEAETLLRDVIARKRDDNGQGGGNAHQNLATALSLQGKHAEALQWHRRSVATQRAREGDVSAPTAVALRELAIAREWAGEDAESDYRAALATAEAVAKDHDIALHGWRVPLAAYLVGAGRCGEALTLLDQALQELGETADPVSVSQARLLRGTCDAAARPAADPAALEQACRALQAMPGIEVDVYPATRKLLATRCGPS